MNPNEPCCPCRRQPMPAPTDHAASPRPATAPHRRVAEPSTDQTQGNLNIPAAAPAQNQNPTSAPDASFSFPPGSARPDPPSVKKLDLKKKNKLLLKKKPKVTKKGTLYLKGHAVYFSGVKKNSANIRRFLHRVSHRGSGSIRSSNGKKNNVKIRRWLHQLFHHRDSASIRSIVQLIEKELNRDTQTDRQTHKLIKTPRPIVY